MHFKNPSALSPPPPPPLMTIAPPTIRAGNIHPSRSHSQAMSMQSGVYLRLRGSRVYLLLFWSLCPCPPLIVYLELPSTCMVPPSVTACQVSGSATATSPPPTIFCCPSLLRFVTSLIRWQQRLSLLLCRILLSTSYSIRLKNCS